MKKRAILLILPAVSLILEMLPYGAVLNFANPLEDGTISTVRQTYSYFDPITFEYANFGPMITAVLTCLLTVLTAVYAVSGIKPVGTLSRIVCVVALVTSIMPMMYGMNYLSAVGLLITASLLCEGVLLNRLITSEQNNVN